MWIKLANGCANATFYLKAQLKAAKIEAAEPWFSSQATVQEGATQVLSVRLGPNVLRTLEFSDRELVAYGEPGPAAATVAAVNRKLSEFVAQLGREEAGRDATQASPST